MTKTVVVLLVVATAATPADALASPQFKATFGTTFLSRHPGASSGLRTRVTWSDPGAPHGVPKVIEEIKLRFPPGTRLDTSALPRCSASDEAIRSTKGAACSRKTRLGSGATIGVSASGTEFTTKVTVFNAKRQIIVIATLNGVLVTEFRDLVRKRTIVVRPALPPGVSLKRLALRMGAFSMGRGAARRVYMRTPPTCPPSRRWTIVGSFKYADGTAQTLERASPCSRTASPPHR